MEQLTQTITSLLSIPDKLDKMLSLMEALELRIKYIEKNLYVKRRDQSISAKWILLEVVSQQLKISKRKLFDLKKKGELKVSRIGKHQYVDEKDLEDFMNQHKINI